MKTHTNLSQIIHTDGTLDAHCWVELPSGMIDDYDAKSLAEYSAYGTNNIVYKEFPLQLQLDLLPYIQKIIKDRKFEGLGFLIDWIDWEDYDEYIMNEVGNCFCRAWKIKQEKGGKIKLGSLGFVQPNGDIFWECG